MAAVEARLGTDRIVLEWDADSHGWAVTVPALPGCLSQGRTPAEALDHAREGIEVHIAGLQADGEPVPPPDEDGPAVSVLTRV